MPVCVSSKPFVLRYMDKFFTAINQRSPGYEWETDLIPKV
jgi:hypothetical protein